MTHFEFYGLPVAFKVDEAAVRRIYLLNSKKYHPDFHTLSGDAEQAQMLELSTRNNEAFKTLTDPDLRMRYVLELNGLLGQGNEQPTLPQDFLMEMMDINEALMDLEFDYDAERHASAQKSIELFENELLTTVASILNNWTEATGTEAELKKVQEYFFKKKYLLRIKENLSKFAPA